MRRAVGAARCALLLLCRARSRPARRLCPGSAHAMTGSSGDSGSTRSLIEGASVPRFAPHAKFRFDEVRQAWIVLAPERLLLPDEQAVEILRLIDRERKVDTVIEELGRPYEAPRDDNAGDDVAKLPDLVH